MILIKSDEYVCQIPSHLIETNACHKGAKVAKMSFLVYVDRS